jgi:hypothetical protein
MGHGDEGRLYNHAGQTALGLATRTGKNVVCGHTHRQGISSASYGFAGNLSTLWGMEVGHLCDLNSSGMRYMKEGHANWQAGFGILYEQDGIVKPELVPFNKNGSFIAEGELWR